MRKSIAQKELAGHTKQLRWPNVARGPQVGQPCFRVSVQSLFFQVLLQYKLLRSIASTTLPGKLSKNFPFHSASLRETGFLMYFPGWLPLLSNTIMNQLEVILKLPLKIFLDVSSLTLLSYAYSMLNSSSMKVAFKKLALSCYEQNVLFASNLPPSFPWSLFFRGHFKSPNFPSMVKSSCSTCKRPVLSAVYRILSLLESFASKPLQ